MIKHRIFLIGMCVGIVMFLAIGCSKTKAPSVHKSKVKRITEYFPETGLGTVDTFVYDFTYAASGMLTGVKLNDSNYMDISMLNAHTIEIKNTDYSSGGVSVHSVYAHVNDLKQIISINTNASTIEPVDAVYTGNATDTFYQPNFFPIFSGFGFYFLMENIQTYGFHFEGGDCISSTVTYLNNKDLNTTGSTEDTNVIHIEYNQDIDNVANFIPLQTCFNDVFAGSLHWIDYTFLMGINGYNYVAPNKHVLKKTDFYVGSDNATKIYEYVTDANKNITQMCVRENTTSAPCISFHFEYY